MDLDGQASGYTASGDFVEPVTRTLRTLETTSGIGGAAVVSRMPLGLGSWVRFYDIPGVAPPAGRDDHRLEYAAISPGYLPVMDIPILAGRGFTNQDDGDAPPVMMVSRALAERLWPGESPVGRTMIPTNDRDNPVTVVGLVDDVAIWTLSEEPRPYIYLPYDQAPSTFVTLIARGTLAPARLQIAVREALRSVDPNLFVPRVTTMAEHMDDTTFLPRMAAILIGSFALLAMALSIIGLYGVVSYGVARRTREMGIRMSLGADQANVIGLVVKGGLSLAVVGVSLGLIAAVAASGLMEQFLVGVTGRDPITLLGVPLLLMMVALVAAFLPARRASRIDPMEALRRE
jgi:predicted permease